MKKVPTSKKTDELRPEYDLSKLKGGVRGKYYERARAGTNLVLIEPDLTEVFPDTDSVNRALRLLAATAEAATIHPRINKGTLWLTKREEGGADQFWIRLHFSEDAGQGGDEFGLGGKVAIVGSVLSGVLP